MENQNNTDGMAVTPQNEAATTVPTESNFAAETNAGVAVPEQVTESHTVTKTDLENNPELAENGVKEGDEIHIPLDDLAPVVESIDVNHSVEHTGGPSDSIPATQPIGAELTESGKALREEQEKAGDKTDLPLS